MTDLRNNAPRRYFVDAEGRRVLIGLTAEETREFEALDYAAPLNDGMGQLAEAEKSGAGDTRLLAEEERWLELYAKHDGAWRVWIDQSRAQQVQDLGFY